MHLPRRGAAGAAMFRPNGVHCGVIRRTRYGVNSIARVKSSRAGGLGRALPAGMFFERVSIEFWPGHLRLLLLVTHPSWLRLPTERECLGEDLPSQTALEQFCQW